MKSLQTEIGVKALKDASFRASLLSDPKGTLQKELDQSGSGVQLPAELKVVVHEEAPDTIHLFVPAAEPERDGLKPLKSITNSETWRKTFVTWDCGCL